MEVLEAVDRFLFQFVGHLDDLPVGPVGNVAENGEDCQEENEVTHGEGRTGLRVVVDDVVLLDGTRRHRF